MKISDETLMAFADGELSADMAQEVSKLAEAEPEVAQRLAQFVATRDALREYARATRADNPRQDEALTRMIREAVAKSAVGDTVSAQPMPAAGKLAMPPPANLNQRPWAAVAAALALALFGGWWFTAGKGAALNPAELQALASLPSGESLQVSGGAQVTIIASYENGNGQFCREFETRQDRTLRNAVACRTGQGWSERFAASTTIDDQSFQPASGEIEALDAFMDRNGMGQPLSSDAEMALLEE